MTQKTAVDWLFEQIPVEWTSTKYAYDAYQQAKEMEREQIINADFAGVERTFMTFHKNYIQIPNVLNIIKNIKEGTDTHEEGEQYYNETFGK